jgi:hypothetical protein
MRLARRILLLGSVLLPLGCRRAQAASRLDGWRNARWNMDGAALDAAFGNAIDRLDPSLQFGPLVADRVVRGVHIGVRRFTAFLQHPANSDHLRQVLLSFAGGKPTPADFAAGRRALEEELGPPHAGSSESAYSASFPSIGVGIQWRFAATHVVLRYVDPNAELYSRVRKTLTVRYTARR